MAPNIAVIGARRRRRAVGTSSSAPADLTTLIAAVGGNSVVVAAYDVRAGVTQASNLVSQWDDARGASGFGPSFTASGTARGIWDPALLTISGDANTVIMKTAASALFDLSGTLAIYYVGTVLANATGSNMAAIACNDNAAFARYLQIASMSTGGGIATQSTTTNTASSAAAPSTTRRLVIGSKDATTAYNQVPNQAVTSVADTTAAGSNNLWLFGDRPGNPSGTAMANTVRAVLVLNRRTAGDVTAIRDWAITNHAAVAA